MATLNAAVSTLPESRATHLQEGFIFGLIPGVITDINDPEGIGRVRVECPLIEPGTHLPNDRDGWIPVVESFVVNSAPGGSHHFLQPGTQVVLSAMFGDPRLMVVLGCLPSRVDRPHPGLNRAQGTHGSYTPGQVLEVNNDNDSSRVVARPNGVVEHISGSGTVTIQTEDHARLQLTHDGNSRIENDQAFTAVTSQGTVAQQSASGAQSVLNADGTVKIQSANQSQLTLDGGVGRLSGPGSSISSIMQQIKKSFGFLGDLHSMLGQLEGVAGDFLPDVGNFSEMLADANRFIGKASNIVGSIDQGLGAIGKLAEVPLAEIGELLIKDADRFLDVSGVIQQADQWLQDAVRPEQIIKNLQALAVNNIPSDAQKMLEGLSYSPDMQLQAIAGFVAEGGFQGVENIFGMGLHKALPQIQEVIDRTIRLREKFQQYEKNFAHLNALDRPQPVSEPNYKALARELKDLIPENIKSPFSEEVLTNLLQSVADTREGTKSILGLAVQGLTGQGGQSADVLASAIQSLPRLQELTDLAANGEPIDQALKGMPELLSGVDLSKAAQEIVPQVISNLNQTLAPVLGNAMKDINQLISAVPNNSPGAVVEATSGAAIMRGLGAAMAKVEGAVAELTAPGSRVFAAPMTVGATSPWGGFSFGAGGSGLLAKGLMTLKAAIDDSISSAGFILDPSKGASLSSFSGDVETSRVRVENDTVFIESLPTLTGIANQIAVSPTGIFINGLPIAPLFAYESRLALLESRLTK